MRHRERQQWHKRDSDREVESEGYRGDKETWRKTHPGLSFDGGEEERRAVVVETHVSDAGLVQRLGVRKEMFHEK